MPGKKKKCGWGCKLVKGLAIALFPPAAVLLVVLNDEITQIIGEDDDSNDDLIFQGGGDTGMPTTPQHQLRTQLRVNGVPNVF